MQEGEDETAFDFGAIALLAQPDNLVIPLSGAIVFIFILMLMMVSVVGMVFQAARLVVAVMQRNTIKIGRNFR